MRQRRTIRRQRDFRRDSVGNRKQITSTLAPIPAGLFNYNANDQFTAGDTYDADGNTASSGGIANTYDFENHLVQKGGVSIVYDGDGNRVQKIVAGVTTTYLVDTLNPTGYAQVIGESFSTASLPNGEVSHNYVYGLEMISQTRKFNVNSNGNTQQIFYAYDGHGSVRALTNTSGTVTDTYDYDAFGNLIHSTGSTLNNYLFAGEQFDPDLNLYYNRARYLNVSTGRFWTMDSYEGNDEDPLSIHKYLYVDADPVDNTDPCGRCLPSIGDWGDIIQQVIFADFEEKTGGVGLNVSINTILGKTVPSGGLLPDLIDPNTLSEFGIGQVYEIKSVYSELAAKAKVALYVSVLNFYGRNTGLKWIPGVTYTPPPIIPIDPSTVAFTAQPWPGVITYCVINQTEMLASAIAAESYALYLNFSSAALTAAYAY